MTLSTTASSDELSSAHIPLSSDSFSFLLLDNIINMGSTSDTEGQIPVIDLSGSSPEPQVAAEIVDAAAKYGFVYIRNQGKDVPVEVIDGIFDLVISLYSLRDNLC
jgi:hypothetical protein